MRGLSNQEITPENVTALLNGHGGFHRLPQQWKVVRSFLVVFGLVGLSLYATVANLLTQQWLEAAVSALPIVWLTQQVVHQVRTKLRDARRAETEAIILAKHGKRIKVIRWEWRWRTQPVFPFIERKEICVITMAKPEATDG